MNLLSIRWFTILRQFTGWEAVNRITPTKIQIVATNIDSNWYSKWMDVILRKRHSVIRPRRWRWSDESGIVSTILKIRQNRESLLQWMNTLHGASFELHVEIQRKSNASCLLVLIKEFHYCLLSSLSDFRETNATVKKVECLKDELITYHRDTFYRLIESERKIIVIKPQRVLSECSRVIHRMVCFKCGYACREDCAARTSFTS